MGVVTANPHIQEVDEVQAKLRRAKDDEEMKVISRELEITKAKRQLADLRVVRQRNLMW